MERKQMRYVIGLPVFLGATLAWTGPLFAEREQKEPEIRGSISVGKAKERDYPQLAKITQEQASRIALERHPGQLLKTELENEDGTLVYNVEVVAPDKKMSEIKVDAGNGRVLAQRIDDEEEDEEKDD